MGSTLVRNGARLAAVALCLALAGGARALAQEAAPGDPALQKKRAELGRLQDEINLSDEVVERIQGQIKSLDADRVKLAKDLIDTAARSRAVEDKVLDQEVRLAALAGEEDGLKASLAKRRGLMIEVVASLQRMGAKPPPALLVRPDDALQAVRSAMLLGAVLPEIRTETEKLAADLAAFSRVRGEMTAERDRLKDNLLALAQERKRIDLLTEERRRIIAQQERNLVGEQVRAAALAKDASNLKDLITRMEREVNAAKEAAKAAETAGKGRASLAALSDPSRLAPAVAFAETKGMLALPVVGTASKRFGEEDGAGGNARGLSLATEPLATVTAPCDGWVVYAGPFRSYGQLLIINAGDGYHVVLSGMDRINVGLGQFVLTGEPVGAMGTGEMRVASTALGAVAQPTLYVEFRKDGVSIDPTPWWADKGEKARG